MIRKIIVGGSLSILFLGILASCVRTAELKIAFVDGKKIFEEAPQAVTAREDLKEKFKSYQDKLDEMSKEIADLTKKFQSNPLFTEEEKENQIDKINKKKEALLEYKRKAETELTKSEAEFTKGIMEKVYDIVEKIAKNRKIDIVLDKASVLYGDATLDITDTVMDKLNENSSKK